MLFKGSFVWCPRLGELSIVHEYLLAVDDRGFITHFDSATATESVTLLQSGNDQQNEIPRGSFLLPTFCDLHLHAPQFLYQGNGLDLPLMQWLDEYAFKAEEKLDENPVLARRVYSRLASRLKENGTGAVMLFGTINNETNLILADVMQQAGIRAFIGKLSMDKSSRPSYVEASATASISAAKDFIEQCRHQVSHLPHERRLVEPVLTPRFVPTCSDELLVGLGKLSETHQARIQSHLAEAHDQIEWVKKERGADDLVIFKRSQLLTPRTIQAHCTFLDTESLHQLKEKGTAIAHCPLSNAYFSAKPFPLREALDAGVSVGLGSDVAGGYSLSTMDCMRKAVMVSRMREGTRLVSPDQGDNRRLSINWIESLYLACRGGAKALGLPGGSGGFEIGSPFDAQCIEIMDKDNHGIGNLDFLDQAEEASDNWLTEEMVEKWWCLGDTKNIANVWVQGLKIA